MYILRPLIYVSGPMLSQGHPYLNIRKGIMLGEFAYNKGWAPIVPHQDVLNQIATGNINLSRYLQVDFSQLAACQAVLLSDDYSLEINAAGEKSGTAQELDLAEILGIPVYTKATLPAGIPYTIDPEDIFNDC